MVKPHRHQHPLRLQRRSPNDGFAMIEALIAILIFSLATLGLLGLQVNMMRAQSSAKFRADAAYLANELVGIVWADSANVNSYNGGNCAGYAPCNAWTTRVSNMLPAGAASASVDSSNGAMQVFIRWQVPNESAHQFVTSTSINANPP
jgi:type IV pilus assembly protein PilV